MQPSFPLSISFILILLQICDLLFLLFFQNFNILLRVLYLFGQFIYYFLEPGPFLSSGFEEVYAFRVHEAQVFKILGDLFVFFGFLGEVRLEGRYFKLMGSLGGY